MAESSGPRGIVTMICLTCGNEKFFTDRVPDALTCDRCGNTVWRQFATPTEPDEATLDQLESQARSIQYGDPSPETTLDELRDLEDR
jgi:hypothetical protein